MTPSSMAPQPTHTVKVGPKESPHQYSPHNITAAVGDVIVFEFYPRNHSVVKADFMAPCVPAVGEIFNSGQFNTFKKNSHGQLEGDPPTWSLVVNDTEPTFFYCTAVDSCLVNGMVGVINPNETMTWEAQFAQARRYPYMLVPGQSPPAEGTGYSSSATNTHNKTSFSGGAIAGTVIGGVAFVGILVVLAITLHRNRYKQGTSSQVGRMERTAHWALFGGHGERKSEQGLTVPSSVAGHGTLSSSSGASPPAVSPPLQNVGYWNWETAMKQPPPQEEIRQPSELEATGGVGGRPGGMYYGWR
ncbi:cupredoxin domain-containing protein [Aspergillus novofumigatus IBT 16806]|uniref:Extracellular serine-rich protein n=1 Tax=Aspergillus novofumigatus (strain IBT 16806) TaxID=1392255 RepID=A0A2I1CF02_ASPN1|nr:extracellular serine-rich protein [Aspergillus novofumigatus IBT 16806]PKX96195.1 extracellular serine-rich protein [Aspergillus novofumigatus IBT 16806]